MGNKNGFSSLFLLLLLLSSEALAFPKQVSVESSNGDSSTQSVSWGEQSFETSQGPWTQFLGRVDLGPAREKLTPSKKSRPQCAIEKGRLVAYISSPISKCRFVNANSKRQIQYKVQAQFADFRIQKNEACKDQSLEIEIAGDKTKLPPGYLGLTCLVAQQGMRISVDYSNELKLVGSRMHEKMGKNRSFKIYDLVGSGRLSNKNDIPINSFKLVSKTNKELVFPVRVYRKSFLLVRQSPFEVELGTGLNQVSFTGGDGTFSTTALRGVMSLSYNPWSGLLLQFDGAADIFGLDDASQGTGSTSYFFYDSRMLFGYRLGSSHQFEVLGGLSFAKYSYQIDVTRRLYSRRGFMGMIKYKKIYKGQTDYWVEALMQQYQAGNSSMSFRLGYRVFRETRLTPWAGLSQVTLVDTSVTTSNSDSGQYLMLGASLDF